MPRFKVVHRSRLGPNHSCLNFDPGDVSRVAEELNSPGGILRARDYRWFRAGDHTPFIYRAFPRVIIDTLEPRRRTTPR